MSYTVLYEDDIFFIVNKKSGILVHKTKYEEKNLIDEIKISRGNYYLVHRIDRYTSGVLILVKEKRNLSLIQQLFAKNEIQKHYIAIVTKELPAKKLKINLSLGRSKKGNLLFSNKNAKNYKSACTEVSEINGFLVSAIIFSGRTHQIRAHLKEIGCPILNDPIYSFECFDPNFGQYLHSYRVIFKCPLRGTEINVIAPPPHQFINKLLELNIPWCPEL